MYIFGGKHEDKALSDCYCLDLGKPKIVGIYFGKYLAIK